MIFFKTFLYELGTITCSLGVKRVHFHSSQTSSLPSKDRCTSYCIKLF